MNSAKASEAMTVLVVISLLAVATKLITLGNFQTHRPFILMTTVWAVSNALPLCMNTASALYFRLYAVLVPVCWALYVLVSRKLYQGVFVEFAGIAWGGKWALNIAGGIAMMFLVVDSLNTDAAFASSRFLTGLLVIDSGLACGLCFLLVILIVAVWFYPVKIRRNMVVHCVSFSAIFFTIATANLVAQAAGPKHTEQVNMIGSGVSALLCIFWLIRVNTEGDIRFEKGGAGGDSVREERLLNQLLTLNGVLVRATRK